MVHEKLELSILKDDDDTPSKRLTYDSIERGKTIDVSVVDVDGRPYNLKDLVIKFIDIKQDSKLVVDSNTSVFDRTDDEGGRFSYTFPNQVFASSGWAKFEFWQSDEKIDTTTDFRIGINQFDDDLVSDDSDYVSALDKLQSKFQEIINNSKEEAGKAVDSINSQAQSAKDQIAKLIEDSKKALDQVISSSDMTAKDYAELNKKLSKLQDLANKLDKNSTVFDDIQKQFDELKKQVSDLEKENLINRFANDQDAEAFMDKNDKGIVVVDEQGEINND